MSEERIVEMETRLIGKEDIAFDETGNNGTSTFTDDAGNTHIFHHINATHVPLSLTARAIFSSITHVEGAVIKLYQMVTGFSGDSLAEDTVSNLPSDGTISSWQEVINNFPKNLNGHTLEIKFPEGINRTHDDEIYFRRFYNGTLIINLSGITISDSAELEGILVLEDLRCKAVVKNGGITHTHSTCAVKGNRCQGVYFQSFAFTGTSATEGSYGFYGVNSDGWYESGTVTVTTDQLFAASSFIASLIDSKVAAHSTSGEAHSSLFALKAPLASPALTGTPTAPTATAGDSSTKIATTAFTALTATAAATAAAATRLPQSSTLPAAGAEHSGACVAYTGPTTSAYNGGAIYRCELNGGTYGWKMVAGGDGYGANALASSAYNLASTASAGATSASAGATSAYNLASTASSTASNAIVSATRTLTSNGNGGYYNPNNGFAIQWGGKSFSSLAPDSTVTVNLHPAGAHGCKVFLSQTGISGGLGWNSINVLVTGETAAKFDIKNVSGNTITSASYDWVAFVY